MKVRVDCADLSTIRRATAGVDESNRITLRVVEMDGPAGCPDVEIAGPRQKVLAWLKRNGYGDGAYEVIEQ